MILYGSTLSPFVRKVMAYAGEKGIEIELKPTRLPDFDPEFCSASPFKKMPALVDGDVGCGGMDDDAGADGAGASEAGES